MFWFGLDCSRKFCYKFYISGCFDLFVVVWLCSTVLVNQI